MNGFSPGRKLGTSPCVRPGASSTYSHGHSQFPLEFGVQDVVLALDQRLRQINRIGHNAHVRQMIPVPDEMFGQGDHRRWKECRCGECQPCLMCVV